MDLKRLYYCNKVRLLMKHDLFASKLDWENDWDYENLKEQHPLLIRMA